MTAPALLTELRGRGVTVAFSGHSLQFDAPRGVMRDLLPEVARLKPALLELLAKPDIAVGRDSMGQRVAAQWQRNFTPAEIEQYNRVVMALNAGINPED